jgi:lipoprotein-anchoring transpeptidase ErfK/SrfK
MNRILSQISIICTSLAISCLPISSLTAAQIPQSVQEKIPLYIEIIDSCGTHFQGSGGCVNARSGPGTTFKSVAKLRNGMILRVAEQVVVDDRIWYKISFNEPLLYPERITSDWYVAGDFARLFHDAGTQNIKPGTKTSKRIVVDRAQQKIFAYDGEELFMEQSVSTGIKTNPTPKGTYTIFKKTPSRYMQGPRPGGTDDYYDLQGVPWNLYFTSRGVVFHGAYWHESFGSTYSHGCVNLPLDKAAELYSWADLGTKVIVK